MSTKSKCQRECNRKEEPVVGSNKRQKIEKIPPEDLHEHENEVVDTEEEGREEESESEPEEEGGEESESETSHCLICEKKFDEAGVNPAQCIGCNEDSSRCNYFDGVCTHESCLETVKSDDEDDIRICQLCDARSCPAHRKVADWWKCCACKMELCEACTSADGEKQEKDRFIQTCIECNEEFCTENNHRHSDLENFYAEDERYVCEYCEIPPTEEEMREIAGMHDEYIRSYARELEGGDEEEEWSDDEREGDY